jgi:23S rRNA (guanosine2251-2'-O)-methyltransferase
MTRPRDPRGELLAGPHAVYEALRAGRRTIHRILIARHEQGGTVAPLRALARTRAILVEERPREELDRYLPAGTHQGVVAEAGPFAYWAPEEVAARALADGGNRFVLALDGVQDPQNLGAIIRSAEAAGADGLVLPRDRAAGVSPAVARASAGAAEHLPIAQVNNLAAFLAGMRDQGFWAVGTAAEAGQDLFAADLTGPIILVIGGEGKGLRALTRARCDYLVRIPLRGQVASLNASAAAAVCLFEVARQRAVDRGAARR